MPAGTLRVCVASPLLRRCAVAVLVVLWVAGACSGASGPNASRDVRLGDGFHVPDGSRLVGRVEPDLASFLPGLSTGAPRRGWAATLAVDGSATSVYRDLAAQASQAGFRNVVPPALACGVYHEPGADGTEQPSGHRGRSCASRGGSQQLGRSVEIMVARCARCAPEVGIGRIVYEGAAGTGRAMHVEPLPVTQLHPSPELENDWSALPGTRVLESAWYFYGCERTRLAVLAVTGDPDAVWQRVLDRVVNPVGGVTTTLGGRRIRFAVASDGPYQQNITMVEGPSGAGSTLTSWFCEG